MSRKILLACAFLLMAVSLAEAAETSQLTADQIVEKNVTARGGLRAWREVQTLSMTGKMDAGGNNRPTIPVPGTKTGPGMPAPRLSEQAQLPFLMELKRSRKMRLEIQFHGQTAIQVYDGTSGWKLRPFLNRREVEPFTPEEKKVASLQSDLDGPLVDYAAKGSKVELEGHEKVEGKDTYKLRLTMKDGQVQHVWVDAQTFLETKIEGAPRRLDGKYHPTAIYYRDYRLVNGLMVPHVLETTVEGIRQTEKIEVEKVAVNPKLDDSRFAKLQ